MAYCEPLNKSSVIKLKREQIGCLGIAAVSSAVYFELFTAKYHLHVISHLGWEIFCCTLKKYSTSECGSSLWPKKNCWLHQKWDYDIEHQFIYVLAKDIIEVMLKLICTRSRTTKKWRRNSTIGSRRIIRKWKGNRLILGAADLYTWTKEPSSDVRTSEALTAPQRDEMKNSCPKWYLLRSSQRSMTPWTNAAPLTKRTSNGRPTRRSTNTRSPHWRVDHYRLPDSAAQQRIVEAARSGKR